MIIVAGLLLFRGGTINKQEELMGSITLVMVIRFWSSATIDNQNQESIQPILLGPLSQLNKFTKRILSQSISFTLPTM